MELRKLVETSESYYFPREFDRTYPIAVRGSGIRIWDREGREYIDASSGTVSVASVGHGSREIAAAMSSQALELGYVNSGEFLHEPGELLAETLARWTPGDLNRSIFVSGGSEAVETAIKLARQYHIERGKPEKSIVVSRRRSYHGATLFALSLGDVPSRKAPYLPYLVAGPQFPAPYEYRRGEVMPDGTPLCGDAEDLERVILECGPQRVSAFIAEPIVGAAGPGITAPAGYYEQVREICDRYDVLFIADEIITGFGRTGKRFGIDHWNAVPDMLVVAKGISGGYAPLGAVVFSDRVADEFQRTGHPFVHVFTYQAHPISSAVGLAVLKIIERDRLVDNAATVGAYMHERLWELAKDAPIGDVRGTGLLAGIELVRDFGTRTPFPPEMRLTAAVSKAALAQGMTIYPGPEPDGVSGDTFIVSPPLIATTEDVDEIVSRLRTALNTVFHG